MSEDRWNRVSRPRVGLALLLSIIIFPVVSAFDYESDIGIGIWSADLAYSWETSEADHYWDEVYVPYFLEHNMNLLTGLPGCAPMFRMMKALENDTSIYKMVGFSGISTPSPENFMSNPYLACTYWGNNPNAFGERMRDCKTGDYYTAKVCATQYDAVSCCSFRYKSLASTYTRDYNLWVLENALIEYFENDSSVIGFQIQESPYPDGLDCSNTTIDAYSGNQTAIYEAIGDWGSFEGTPEWEKYMLHLQQLKFDYYNDIADLVHSYGYLLQVDEPVDDIEVGYNLTWAITEVDADIFVTYQYADYDAWVDTIFEIPWILNKSVEIRAAGKIPATYVGVDFSYYPYHPTRASIVNRTSTLAENNITLYGFAWSPANKHFQSYEFFNYFFDTINNVTDINLTCPECEACNNTECEVCTTNCSLCNTTEIVVYNFTNGNCSIFEYNYSYPTTVVVENDCQDLSCDCQDLYCDCDGACPTSLDCVCDYISCNTTLYNTTIFEITPVCVDKNYFVNTLILVASVLLFIIVLGVWIIVRRIRSLKDSGGSK